MELRSSVTERVFLPARPGESDEEQRLREALNRLAGQMMDTIDSAIGFRTADAEARRVRHRARGHIQDGMANAMLALHLKSTGPVPAHPRR